MKLYHTHQWQFLICTCDAIIICSLFRPIGRGVRELIAVLFFYKNRWPRQLPNQPQRIQIRLQVVVQHQQTVLNAKQKNTIVGRNLIKLLLCIHVVTFFKCRSDLVCRVRYTNVLPDLPFDPKFLRYPFSQDRFVKFFHFH